MGAPLLILLGLLILWLAYTGRAQTILNTIQGK